MRGGAYIRQKLPNMDRTNVNLLKSVRFPYKTSVIKKTYRNKITYMYTTHQHPTNIKNVIKLSMKKWDKQEQIVSK